MLPNSIVGILEEVNENLYYVVSWLLLILEGMEEEGVNLI